MSLSYSYSLRVCHVHKPDVWRGIKEDQREMFLQKAKLKHENAWEYLKRKNFRMGHSKNSKISVIYSWEKTKKQTGFRLLSYPNFEMLSRTCGSNSLILGEVSISTLTSNICSFGSLYLKLSSSLLWFPKREVWLWNNSPINKSEEPKEDLIQSFWNWTEIWINCVLITREGLFIDRSPNQ